MTKLAKGILPALCTPFDSNGELNTNLVGPLVQRLLAAGANGFFVCGGTGEGKSMTVPERRQMASVVIHEVAGAVPNILHVGGAPTRDCIELAKHAAEAGADAIASVAPIDQAANLEAAVKHLVCLVQYHESKSPQLYRASLHVVHQPTRSSHDYVGAPLQRLQLANYGLAPVDCYTH